MQPADFDLGVDFEDSIEKSKAMGYRPKILIFQLREHGAVGAARYFLHAGEASELLTRLVDLGDKHGRDVLGLSVEAIVLKPQHRELFSAAELEVARERLRAVEFEPPWCKELSTGVPKLPSPPISVDASPLSKPELPPGIIAVMLPPIADAEKLVAHIRSIAGKPERNMEDAVKQFLLALGHTASVVRFQVGRIDLQLSDESGVPLVVFEVKRSIASDSEKAGARRQAMDYAGRTGAPLFVITDSDRYEIYDRRKGLDYGSMFCGDFRMTAFSDQAIRVLDLLRPSTKCG